MFRLNRAKPIPFTMPVLQSPETFEGGSFKAGFFRKYAPSIVASILGILIELFSLSTNWFAKTSIEHMHLDARFRHRSGMRFQNFYIALTDIFFSLCIVATICIIFYVMYFVHKLVVLRRRFFDVRDGVKDKENVLEKFSGEGFILLLVICKDLPLSFLLLALQLQVNCDCLMVVNGIVFYMCIVSTFLSIVWKLGQVIWSSGCCGKRTKYESGRIINVFRIITSLFLICALIVTFLNSMLVMSGPFTRVIRPSYASGNAVFDKIYIEKWLNEEKVVFIEKRMKVSSNFHNDSHSAEMEEEPRYINVSLLTPLIDNYNHAILKYKNCMNKEMSMSSYINQSDRSLMQSGANCKLVFKLLYDPRVKTLYYNYAYIVTGNDVPGCKQGLLLDNRFGQNSSELQETAPQQAGPSSLDSNSEENSEAGGTSSTLSVLSMMLLSAVGEENSKPMLHNPCDIKIRKSQQPFQPCSNVASEQ